MGEYYMRMKEVPLPRVIRTRGIDLIDNGAKVDVGELQSKDIRGIDALVTRELLNVSFSSPLPDNADDLAILTNCNLPWAEDHFQERVGGVPLNPGEQYKNWPWFKGNVEQHQKCCDNPDLHTSQAGTKQCLNCGKTIDESVKFSHSYMERYWPKFANKGQWPQRGIRYEYGDLNDVVNLLARSPYTRQAYLPVWFPEDTGAAHGERVPCSLGYHFILRDGQLHIVYYIRSCDFVRHFRDDIYLTGRLAQWVLHQLHHTTHVDANRHWAELHPVWKDVKIGTLTMHITSLHCFEGDLPKMRREYGS